MQRWLITYFGIALEADSPILEAIDFHWKQDPKEVWTRLEHFDPLETDQPLVDALGACHWKVDRTETTVIGTSTRHCIRLDRGLSWWTLSETLNNYRVVMAWRMPLFQSHLSSLTVYWVKVDASLRESTFLEVWFFYKIEPGLIRSLPKTALRLSNYLNGLEDEFLDIFDRPISTVLWGLGRDQWLGEHRSCDQLRSVLLENCKS